MNPGMSDDGCGSERALDDDDRRDDEVDDEALEHGAADVQDDSRFEALPSWDALADGSFRVSPAAFVVCAAALLGREGDAAEDALQRLESAIETTADRLWKRSGPEAAAMRRAAPVLENVLWAAKNNHKRHLQPWCFDLLRLVLGRWVAEGLRDDACAEEALGVTGLVCDALSRRCVPEPLAAIVAPLLCARVGLENGCPDIASGGFCSAAVAAGASAERFPKWGGEYLCSVRAPAETTNTTESHDVTVKISKNTDLTCLAGGVSGGSVRKPRGGRRATAGK